jgi:hypothetical protein
MKLLIKFLAIIIFMLSVSACRPYSKESYLEKYDSFIKEVSEKGTNYSDKDWTKAEEKYKKFNEDWYNRFKDELTWQEKLTTTKHTLQYSYYKNKTGALDLYNTYLKGDLEKLKEKIKYYKENNMDDDLQAFINHAKEIGDSSAIIIQNLVGENDKELIQNKN